jgi:hypothetical protein
MRSRTKVADVDVVAEVVEDVLAVAEAGVEDHLRQHQCPPKPQTPSSRM